MGGVAVNFRLFSTGGVRAPCTREVSEAEAQALLPSFRVPQRLWIWPRVPSLRRFNPATVKALWVVGDCLAPWFITGDLVYFDPTLPASDGDLVVFDMTYVLVGEGLSMEHKAAKQLRVLEDGSRYLVCNDGYLVADQRPFAPVVAWSRARWWRRPPVRELHFDLPVRFMTRRAAQGQPGGR